MYHPLDLGPDYWDRAWRKSAGHVSSLPRCPNEQRGAKIFCRPAKQALVGGEGLDEKASYFRLARGVCGTRGGTGRLLGAQETRADVQRRDCAVGRHRGRRALPDHRQQARSNFDQADEMVEGIGSAWRLYRRRIRDGAIHETGFWGDEPNL